MSTAQTKKGLDQRFEKLNRNWDFWTCFAWIETRSIDLLEEIHAYRTTAAVVHNASNKVPVIIDRVCKFAHNCGKKSNCALWQDTQRKLSAQCSDKQLTAYGIHSSTGRLGKIPANDWLLGESVDDPTSLDINNGYWSRILFPAAIITTQYPPRGKPMSASRPSNAELRQYVQSKVSMRWTMRKTWMDAQTHFLPNSPTRRSVENAYRLLVPAPRKGRPPNA
jgi:hypothetical protein